MARISLVYDGYGASWKDHGPFDASDLAGAPHGLSGTEIPMFGMAFELAQWGHGVTVYSRFEEEIALTDHPDEGWTGADDPRDWPSRPCVKFRDLDSPKDHCDLAIAFHDGRRLDGWPAKKKALLAQCFLLPNRSQTAEFRDADFADIYITATDHVARHLERAYGWPKVHVVPNAWDFGAYHPWKPIPGRIIYTTSLERGFHRLLEAFPAIRERVPEAHVVAFERGGPAVEKLKANPVEGVTLLKASSLNAVLEELAKASVMAYPCDPSAPTEVFPLSILQACATGLPVVLAPDDNLEELLGDGVMLSPGVKQNPGTWLGEFVGRVVGMLWSQETSKYWSMRGRRFAAPFTHEASTRKLCEAVGL